MTGRCHLHAVYHILREMSIEQQETRSAFRYAAFKARIAQTEMTPAQLGPLTQRLENLGSFMPNTQTGVTNQRRKAKGVARQHGNDWASKVSPRAIIRAICSNDFSPVALILWIYGIHALLRKGLALSLTSA